MQRITRAHRALAVIQHQRRHQRKRYNDKERRECIVQIAVFENRNNSLLGSCLYAHKFRRIHQHVYRTRYAVKANANGNGAGQRQRKPCTCFQARFGVFAAQSNIAPFGKTNGCEQQAD